MKIGKQDIRKDNIGSWPTQIRITIIAIVVLLLLTVAYWFDVSSLLGKKNQLQREEQTLKINLAQKQQIAANLPAYQQQLAKAKADLTLLTNQLPGQAEMPALIEEISKLGQANGLRFTLLQPNEEIKHTYYIEFPLHIVVQGHYPQIQKFVNAIANMQRIVSINNFRLLSDGNITNNQSPMLNLDFTAITYRYDLNSVAISKEGKS